MCADRSTRFPPRRALTFLASLLLLGFLVVSPAARSSRELVLEIRRADEPLLVLPMEPGERFTIRYTHSVDRQPVWEVHSVGADGTIFLEEERCVMFGAGMGAVPGRGRLVSRGPYQVVEGIHEPIGDFVLRIADHTIEWRHRRFELARRFGGEAVRVGARHR